MKVWYYEFEDGYYCWTVGKMDKAQLAWEKRTHGKVVVMAQRG